MINLKAAKALGLQIPDKLLVLAIRRKSTMNEQAVQERRGRGFNIAEVAFYSVPVLVVMLLSAYVPA